MEKKKKKNRKDEFLSQMHHFDVACVQKRWGGRELKFEGGI